MKASRKIIFASSNKNKLIEVQTGLAAFGIEVVGPDFVLDVEENASSYLGNARLKADAYGEKSNFPCLSDDSGIEVSALNWGPGIFSARFAGLSASSAENNAKLLEVLVDAADRRARMRSVLCLRLGVGEYLFTEGILDGAILEAPRGISGWGYEPLFCIAEYSKSTAELRDARQEFETHRTRAVAKMGKLLSKMLP